MDSVLALLRAALYLPVLVQIWLAWMLMVLFIAPLVFLRHGPAQWLAGVQLINIATAFAIFVGQGHDITRIFGLGHVLWLIPLGLLAKDAVLQSWSHYRIFAILASLTIIVSLVFDFRDLWLWVEGDHGSVLIDAPDLTPGAEPAPEEAAEPGPES